MVKLLRRLFISLISGLIFWSVTAGTAWAAPVSVKSVDPEMVEGEIIVKFESGVGDARMAEIAAGIGGAITKTLEGPGYRLVKINDAAAVAGTLDVLNGSPEVVFAEQNARVNASKVPDDPLFRYQWNFTQMNLTDAWDISTGSGATVAVIDTGVALENYGSFRLITDLAGTSFVPGRNFLTGDGHANDDHGHGSHVAGTIAQSTDNGIGVAGVAYGASIMPVKVLDSSGSGTIDNVASGIRWAADNGAKVINLSLGTSFASRTLEDAVNYARYSRNVVVVAAAGNNGGTGLSYPAAFDSVIAVAATDYNQSLTWYSQRGSGLDLVAPGGDTRVDLNGDGQVDGIMQQTIGPRDPLTEGFYQYQGTSMATPHVSGAAALLIAKGISDAAEVYQLLTSTAKDLGAAGYDTSYGYGFVDAAAALRAEPLRAPAIESPSGGERLTGGDPITIRWNKLGASDLRYNLAYAANAGGTEDFGEDFEGDVSSDFTYNQFPWFLTSEDRRRGSRSLRSMPMSDNQTSEVSITRNIIASGTLGFWYRVSSEYNFDFLNFSIDGARQFSRSGNEGWSYASFPVSPGLHTFKWSYQKDYSVSAGQDGAWIDDIVIPNTTPTEWREIVGATAPGASSYDWRLPEVDSDNFRVRVRAVNGAAGSAWSESGDLAVHIKPLAFSWWDSGPGNWEWRASKAVTGDFNGDGREDIAVLYGYAGARCRLFIFTAAVDGFNPPQIWWDSGPGNWDWGASNLMSGDFNQDGRADLAILYGYASSRQSRAWVFAAGETGGGFNAPQVWWDSGANNWDIGGGMAVSGDFTGDGKSDIGIFYGYAAERDVRAFVLPSTGRRFNGAEEWWHAGTGKWDWSGSKPVSGDFTGDGKADLGILYGYAAERDVRAFVLPSTGRGFSGAEVWWHAGPGNWDWSGSKPTGGDIDGDGRYDLNVLYGYGNSLSRLWSLRSGQSGLEAPRIIWDSGAGRWNWEASTPLTADFDGDGGEETIIFHNLGGGRTRLDRLNY